MNKQEPLKAKEMRDQMGCLCAIAYLRIFASFGYSHTTFPTEETKAGFVEYEDECESKLLNIIIFVLVSRVIAF